MLRRQDGQILPGLLVVLLALLAFGMLFFQVGRAAICSLEAQTAADAAALAGATDDQAPADGAVGDRPARPASPSSTARW